MAKNINNEFDNCNKSSNTIIINNDGDVDDIIVVEIEAVLQTVCR